MIEISYINILQIATSIDRLNIQYSLVCLVYAPSFKQILDLAFS